MRNFRAFFGNRFDYKNFIYALWAICNFCAIYAVNFLLSVSKCPDRLARAIYAIKMAFMLQLKFI